MVIIIKKSSTSQRDIDHDLKVNDLVCDNLTVLGNITNPSLGSYVTLDTAQTITAKKIIETNVVGSLDTLEIRNITNGITSGAECGILLNMPNLNSGSRSKTIFMDGNTNNVNVNGDICFMDLNLGNKVFACFHSQNLNYFMNLPQPGSKYKIENVQILAKQALNLSGIQVNITMGGTLNNRLDLGFNMNIHTDVNTGIIDFRNIANNFFRLDSIKKSLTIGDNPVFLGNIRALFSSGINFNYAILLPRMTTAGELNYINIVGADNQYDGSIWYNKDIHQLRGMFNNIPFNIHHGGTQDINANQIGGNTITNTEYSHLQGITSNIQTQLNNTTTLAGVETITNKTIDADNNTITNIDDSSIKINASIDVKKLANGSVDNNRFNFLMNVTSDIQTQLNTKSFLTANTFTGVQTINNNLIIRNNDIIRLRSDFLVSNPDIHCLSYLNGFEGVCVATSDTVTPTSLSCGYFTGDNKVNGYVEKASFVFNNVADSAILKLNNKTMLTNTNLGTSVINSSLQNINNDILEINGQTNIDAHLKIIRQTGEFINLSSRVSGAFLANNNGDLLEINDTVSDFKKGNININDTSKTLNINGVNCIQYDITHLDYFTSSTTYSTAVTFVHKLNRPFTNLTGISASSTGTQQFRIINKSTGGTVLSESGILPIGINATTIVIGGVRPVNNAVIQIQVRRVAGSGSVSFSGGNID